ncbi:uncharacterized protein LOC9629609 [Selaginella moellendorffii]|uniref:uncharacterized protein LOC9629609 n=1 Tax=Selaginella moellendorffii TaxID=88036 RepID=UPI000D1C8704|nr:uncharacterized protein LOC9629609 [Selaginella moellendorffii]XP_024536122.1 uncharacterized protein LOC9629609 [Selaginella moellendorffii]|eukprot:XP_024536121.1 uncharacterized protein LOC9629609 [Selaginella moellendorffii]
MELSTANSQLPSLGSVLGGLMLADKREINRACLPGFSSSTNQRLIYLLEHVKCLSNDEGTIVKICVTLLRDPKNRKKALLIIQWLFRKDEAWNPVVKTLTLLICSTEFDRHIKLGSCLVVKELLDNISGQRELASREFQSATIFSTCVPHLVGLVRDASVKDGNKILPTRLTIAAADCALGITKFLACAQDTNLDTSLWDQRDKILALVSELYQWNCDTRLLYAAGLMQVQNHLRQIAASEDKFLSSSVLRLCWKEYSSLLISDAHTASFPSQSFQRFLTGLQHHMPDGDRESEKSWSKMRCYFLTCLALLLGHLDADKLDSLSLDDGELSRLLLCMLSRNEKETVVIAVAILRFLLSKFINTEKTSKDFMVTFEKSLMEAFYRNERPSTTTVNFVAEYFLLHPSPDLQRVFLLIDSENLCRRQNGIDILETLVQRVCDSKALNTSSLSHILATHLLKRVHDGVLMDRTSASALFVKLDPSVVMPSLIQLLYDPDQKAQHFARSTLLAILEHNSDQRQAVSVLLDCVRNLSLASRAGEGGTSVLTIKTDIDQIMSLLPSWAPSVKNWNVLAIFLLEKMFSDPSNPLLPRFLSEISSHLADVHQLVFARTLQEMLEVSTNKKDVGDQNLFRNLSPLLVLKLLPLRAYDAIECEELYAPLQGLPLSSSITGMLIEWMCTSEFDDVRKLSAELSGRLLPEVLLPLVIDILRIAMNNMDIVAVKSCLYSICSSLMTRGCQNLSNDVMGQIKALLTTMLLWPTNSEEVQKAQHGCIDSFAFMIRAEFNTSMIQMIDKDEGNKVERVINGVMSCLQNRPYAIATLCGTSPADFCSSVSIQDATCVAAPVSFRVCMANVLISSSSKITASSHDAFLSVIPVVSALLKRESESIVRAACVQVLFSAVCNLKEAASLPAYAKTLLDISLDSLNNDKAADEERLAGVKLLAALLVHESILKEGGSSLVNALQVLSRVSRADPSPEVRKLCEQLLSCVSS